MKSPAKFSCGECTKGYSDKSSLVRHQFMDHPNPESQEKRRKALGCIVSCLEKIASIQQNHYKDEGGDLAAIAEQGSYKLMAGKLFIQKFLDNTTQDEKRNDESVYSTVSKHDYPRDENNILGNTVQSPPKMKKLDRPTFTSPTQLEIDNPTKVYTTRAVAKRHRVTKRDCLNRCKTNLFVDTAICSSSIASHCNIDAKRIIYERDLSYFSLNSKNQNIVNGTDSNNVVERQLPELNIFIRSSWLHNEDSKHSNLPPNGSIIAEFVVSVQKFKHKLTRLPGNSIVTLLVRSKSHDYYRCTDFDQDLTRLRKMVNMPVIHYSCYFELNNNDSYFEFIAYYLRRYQFTKLDLSSVLGVTAWFRSLAMWDTKILDLQKCGLVDKDILLLSMILPNTKIQILCLRNNCFTYQGAYALALAIPRTKIELMDLENNHLDILAVQAICDIFRAEDRGSFQGFNVDFEKKWEHLIAENLQYYTGDCLYFQNYDYKIFTSLAKNLKHSKAGTLFLTLSPYPNQIPPILQSLSLSKIAEIHLVDASVECPIEFLDTAMFRGYINALPIASIKIFGITRARLLMQYMNQDSQCHTFSVYSTTTPNMDDLQLITTYLRNTNIVKLEFDGLNFWNDNLIPIIPKFFENTKLSFLYVPADSTKKRCLELAEIIKHKQLTQAVYKDSNFFFRSAQY
ncbi:hypothetical protein HDV06_002217 [Boothiomyces sp. JEL0866]|nr:hypothetical protein HDV06_002217 [Boothiomyces sp. JEL0866]